MRGRRAGSVRCLAQRLAPSDRAVKVAIRSPSSSRQGSEMALRDVSCRVFGVRGPQVGIPPRETERGGTAFPGASGRRGPQRRGMPQRARVSARRARPPAAAPSATGAHGRCGEGAPHVWVGRPRALLQRRAPLGLPSRVASLRRRPRRNQRSTHARHVRTRSGRRPRSARVTNGAERARWLPPPGLLPAVSHSLGWHLTSLPSQPGERSPRVSDRPAPHRAAHAHGSPALPAAFCIYSFIPQFFTQKADAGAPGLGFRRDGSGWPWSTFASVSSHAHPTGPGRHFSPGGNSVPLPGGHQAMSGDSFGCHDRGRDALVASGGKGWGAAKPPKCPRLSLKQSSPAPDATSARAETASLGGILLFQAWTTPLPPEPVRHADSRAPPRPPEAESALQRAPQGTCVGWTVCQARVWSVDPPSHGTCWSLSAHCLVAPHLGPCPRLPGLRSRSSETLATSPRTHSWCPDPSPLPGLAEPFTRPGSGPCLCPRLSGEGD